MRPRIRKINGAAAESGSPISQRLAGGVQPFFFSKSFMKDTRASTPSIGNAL